MEFTTYNKKGKPIQTEKQEVTSFSSTPSGFEMDISSTIFNKKGKELMSSELSGECKNGVYYFDVRNLLNDQMMQPFSGMEVTLEGEPLEIPNDINVGQSLPSGDLKISAGSDGANFLNMTINVTDREVTGKEEVTTPAGTFDCFVIEQDIAMKMMIKSEYHSKEYLTERYGPVRIETYNKSGKLVSTRDLTKVN